MKNLKHYEFLSALFRFPRENIKGDVKKASEILSFHYADQADVLAPFVKFAQERPLLEIEELHTRTFEVQSLTTLDLGYVLFGDDYKRGELLVNLNRELGDAQIDCQGELPDHLSNILCLLSKLNDQELITDLVNDILLPALNQMIGEFGEDRRERKNVFYQKQFKSLIESSQHFATIYQLPLLALRGVLIEDFDLPQDVTDKTQATFLTDVSKEMEIENDASQ